MKKRKAVARWCAYCLRKRRADQRWCAYCLRKRRADQRWCAYCLEKRRAVARWCAYCWRKRNTGSRCRACSEGKRRAKRCAFDGAFCVEAGVSPRDGSGYKKGGTDLSQVRPAEVKCYKSGYKKPSG